jgi:Serine aminopeptidase, S33
VTFAKKRTSISNSPNSVETEYEQRLSHLKADVSSAKRRQSMALFGLITWLILTLVSVAWREHTTCLTFSVLPLLGATEDYVRDVEAVMAIVKAREPDLPIFMLGHSAGGVVACIYTFDHPTDMVGLISESFAHELPAPDFALAVFKGLSQIAPHAHVLHLPNESFSRDRKVVEAMNNDSLIAHET